MDLTTIVGLIAGLVVIVLVMIMDGGSPLELFAHPSAIFLIFGGSLAATTITTSLDTVKSLPKFIMIAMRSQHYDVESAIEMLVQMADKARRQGLLALEEDGKKVTDSFMRKGIMMVVDGAEPAQVRAILETNIEQMRERHHKGYGFFTAAGGFAPTFGIIGTVMGLISVLKALDNPNLLAKSIAAAFLATLWGLLTSNMIYLPLGAKLKAKSDEEAHVRYMQLEGILSIQAGENPRIVRDKLNAYLPPSRIKGDQEGAQAPGRKSSGAAEKAKA